FRRQGRRLRRHVPAPAHRARSAPHRSARGGLPDAGVRSEDLTRTHHHVSGGDEEGSVIGDRVIGDRAIGDRVVNRRLQTGAAVSFVYDALIGVALMAGRPLLSQLFGVPLPQPPIHAALNSLFLLAVAAGYAIPYREPDSSGGRLYMWVMGPLLKG